MILYLSSLEQLAWHESSSLSEGQIKELNKSYSDILMESIKEVNPDIELRLLEHWPNSVAVKSLPDVSDHDVTLYLQRLNSGLELHLAMQYKDNHPGMFQHTPVPKLGILDQILAIMHTQNMAKLEKADRDSIPVFRPLYAAFTFGRKFNPEKGYLLCLTKTNEISPEQVAQMLDWDDYSYKTHYLDCNASTVVDEKEEMRTPDLTLPDLEGEKMEYVPRHLNDYKTISELFFYTAKEALSHLDFVFSSDRDGESVDYSLRYNSFVLIYEHNGKPRTMRLFFSQDKKQVWLTGYVPESIIEEL
jgi:hypothetical protein